MEEYQLIRKWLVVGIVLLLIGLTVTPRITRVVGQKDERYIPITTSICGQPNMCSHTILMTETKFDELKRIVADIEQKLNTALTKQEATDIFRDAVDVLYPFGLFGLVDQQEAKKQLTGEYVNNYGGFFSDGLLSRYLHHNGKPTDYEYFNKFCLVFYRLKTNDDYVLSIIIPYWWLIFISINPLFGALGIPKSFLGLFWFITFAGITGRNFNIKTFGLYGSQDININDYGTIYLHRFTGLRIQSGWDPYPIGEGDFSEGFLLGYAHSITS